MTLIADSSAFSIRTPLRHTFTLELPDPYRTQTPDVVAISLFMNEMFREGDLTHVMDLPPPHHGCSADLRRFGMECFGFHVTLFWLSEEEFSGALGDCTAQLDLVTTRIT